MIRIIENQARNDQIQINVNCRETNGTGENQGGSQDFFRGTHIFFKSSSPPPPPQLQILPAEALT